MRFVPLFLFENGQIEHIQIPNQLFHVKQLIFPVNLRALLQYLPPLTRKRGLSVCCCYK